MTRKDVADVSEDPENTAPRQAASMDQDQFAELLTTVATTVATALRQPPPPPQTASSLTKEQQAVALHYRLLRNGLGRFQTASEAPDHILLRVDQVQHYDSSELVFHDPIPDDAAFMVLVVDSQRETRPLAGSVDRWRFGSDVQRVVELVEFLDESKTLIAAGVPLQVQGDARNRYPEPVDTSTQDEGPPYGPPSKTRPRSQRS